MLASPFAIRDNKRTQGMLVASPCALTNRERKGFEMAHPPLCKVKGCDKPVHRRAFCATHDYRNQKYGDPLAGRVSPGTVRICEVEGCDERVDAQGLCRVHYRRWRRHGDPQGGGPQRPPRGSVLEYIKENMHAGCSSAWPFSRSVNGYPQAKIEGKTVLVHRYVCELVNGSPPTIQHQAAHHCGIRTCINGDCLWWATPSENNNEKLVHGTDNRGEKHHSAKLTESEVLLIRAQKDTVPLSTLAMKFDVTPQHIWAIQSHLYWSWLK